MIMGNLNINLLKQNTNGAISDFYELMSSFLDLIFHNQQEFIPLQLLPEIPL